MKLHHFTLCFAVVAIGFFLTAQIRLVTKLQKERTEKMEYDCLVAAVNAAVETAFGDGESSVTKAGLAQTEEVFFHTLGVLQEGKTDSATWQAWREHVPCLVVFGEKGYYRYCFVPGKGYVWSELIPYQEGQIPEAFFSETEELLLQYHNLQYCSSKQYRMEQAGKGIWEQSIKPPCVFAVYAPRSLCLMGQNDDFLYAASGRRTEVYLVTEDNICHLPFCEKCKEEKVVARYVSQKESAEDGAVPCESCLQR